MNENAIDRKLVYAFIAGLISDDAEREKGLEYIRNMPAVNPQLCEDAISRQAAINLIRGCNSALEEPRIFDTYNSGTIFEHYITELPSVNPQEPKTDSWSIKDVVDTFKKHGLIREQEPCEDAISRTEAIKMASGYCHPANVAKELAKLPPVTPQPKTGHWIPVSERLPEEGQWVMVTFDGKIAVCIAHDNDGTLREATSLVLKNATEIWLYPESEWGDGYAAWMPLPKPYEPQERSDKE